MSENIVEIVRHAIEELIEKGNLAAGLRAMRNRNMINYLEVLSWFTV